MHTRGRRSAFVYRDDRLSFVAVGVMGGFLVEDAFDTIDPVDVLSGGEIEVDASRLGTIGALAGRVSVFDDGDWRALADRGVLSVKAVVRLSHLGQLKSNRIKSRSSAVVVLLLTATHGIDPHSFRAKLEIIEQLRPTRLKLAQLAVQRLDRLRRFAIVVRTKNLQAVVHRDDRLANLVHFRLDFLHGGNRQQQPR